MGLHRIAIALTAICGAGAFAHIGRADIIYTLQERTITAATSANGQTLTLSAPDFGPFVQSLLTSTPFNQPGGTTGTNSGGSTIDCLLNPNTVRATGHLEGEGGTDDNGNDVFGEGSVLIDVTFQITQATPFSLHALARPGTSLLEEFELRLRDVTNNDDLFELDTTTPPQIVDFSGNLQPGIYRLKYKVETIITGPVQSSDFALDFTVPTPGVMSVLVCVPWLCRRKR